MSHLNIIEARPRRPEEIASMKANPDILHAAHRRGVKDVVHFIRKNGLVGVMASGAVKSRKRLSEEEYLEHVYQPNVEIRKDTAWLDYVNLSVQRINDWMFAASRGWHAKEGNPWVVLSFKPEILSHPGVVFTTTNNIYPSCLRAEGLPGFLRMFEETVWGRHGQPHCRSDKIRSAWPTDRQAEVLYPGEVSCNYLQRIDVQHEETGDDIQGVLGGLGLSVPVRYAPEVFA